MQMNGVRQIELIASASQSAGTASGTAKPTYEFPASDQHAAYKGHTKRGRLIHMVSTIGTGTQYGILQGRVPGTDGTQAYHWYRILTTDLLSANGANAPVIVDHIPPIVRGQLVTATEAVVGELHLEISS